MLEIVIIDDDFAAQRLTQFLQLGGMRAAHIQSAQAVMESLELVA